MGLQFVKWRIWVLGGRGFEAKTVQTTLDPMDGGQQCTASHQLAVATEAAEPEHSDPVLTHSNHPRINVTEIVIVAEWIFFVR